MSARDPSAGGLLVFLGYCKEIENITFSGVLGRNSGSLSSSVDREAYGIAEHQ